MKYSRKPFLFILAAFLLGCAFVDRKSYASLLFNTISSNMRKNGINIHSTDTDFTWLGLKSKQVELHHKSLGISTVLKNPKFSFTFSELLRGKTIISGSGEIFGGTVQILHDIIRDTSSIRMSDLKIAELPQTKFLRLESGRISGDIVELKSSNKKVLSFQELDISLTNVNKSKETTIPRQTFQTLTDLAIPPIQNGSLSLKAEQKKENVFTIENFTTDSSLLFLKGDGSIDLTKPKPFYETTLIGSITEEGFESLGTPLKLFSSGKIKQANQEFSLKAFGNVGAMPTLKIEPLNK